MSSPQGDSFKIADAYVLIGGNLDDKSVQDAIRKAQAAINRVRLDLSVGLDKKTLNASVATVQSEVRALNKDLNVKLGVEVDDKQLADASAELKAASDALGHSAAVRLDVGLNQSSVAKTAADLKASTRLLGKDNQISLKVDESGLSEADNEVQRFSNHWSRLAMIVGAGLFVGAGPVDALGLASAASAFAALGIAAESSDPRVSGALKDMTAAAKQTAVDGFLPLVPTLEGIAEEGTTAVESLENSFNRASMQLAPQLSTIADGLVDAVQEGVDRTEPELQRLGPLAASVGQSAITLERGVTGFINNIDPNRAVQGWNSLSGAVGKVLPPLSQVLNTVAPLSNVLITDFGNAVSTVEREVTILNPVMEASGFIMQHLGGVLDVVTTPVLVLATGAKLLTGSFTNWSGAGAKLSGIMSDFPGMLQSVSQKMGFTTAAALAEAKAEAELAVQEASRAKDVDELLVAERELEAQNAGTAESTIALMAAEKQLAVSSAAAAEAEAELAAAEEAGQFALGPLGIALGVIGAGIALFAGKSKDAAPPVQDLTSDLEHLAAAGPGAAQGVLANDPALQKLVNGAKAAGVDVNAMLTAIAGGPDKLKKFEDGINTSTTALGNQQIQVTKLVPNTLGYGESLVRTNESVKELAESVAGNTSAYSELTPQQKKAVDNYNSLNNILGQLNTTQGDQKTQQSAVNAVTSTASAQQQTWNSYLSQAKGMTAEFGGTLSATAVDMANFAAEQKNGTFSLEDYLKAQVSAAGANLQAEQTHQQLAEAVTQSAQQETQAAQQVSSANNALKQSEQQVTDARHSAVQASGQVSDALHSEQASIRAVADANKQVSAAQLAEKQANVQYIADLKAIITAENSVTAARKAAVLELQAEQRQVLDQNDSVGEAEINLFNAQQAVITAGLQNTKLKLSDLANQKNLNSTNVAAYQTLLQLSEAQHQLNDAKAQQSQLDGQNAADQKAGINGNQGVLSAQQALLSAQSQASQQQQQLAQSKDAITKASQGVADAEYAEKQAHDAVAQAQYAQHQAQLAVAQASLAEHQADISLTQAITGQTTARNTHNQAVADNSHSLDINTLAGNRNVTELLGLYDSQIAAGKGTDAARTAVEKEGTKLGFTKTAVDKLIGSITNVQGKTATFGIVGQPSVDLSELINAAISQGLNPKSLGFSSSQIGNARATVPTGSSFATGGQFRGRGGPRDDANLIAVSDKEFIVNADATQSNLALLHAINSGAFRGGFASGGAIGSDGASIMSANLMLAEMGGFFSTTREAMNLVGMKTNSLPVLPKQNPPQLAASFGGSGFNANGDNSAHGASAAVAQAYAASQLARYGWGANQMAPLIKLWNQESGWNDYAVNPSSGAYGIPQALGHGHPYNLGDYAAQINWGLNYIQGRYGSPGAAWQHEVGFNWYDQGGQLAPGATLALNGTGRNETVRTGAEEDRIVMAIQALGSRVMGGVTINHIYKVDAIKTAQAVEARANQNNTWDLMHMVVG